MAKYTTPAKGTPEYDAWMARLDHILATGSLCKPSRDNTITNRNQAQRPEAPAQDNAAGDVAAYMQQMFNSSTEYIEFLHTLERG